MLTDETNALAPLTHIPPVEGVVEGYFEFEPATRAIERYPPVARVKLFVLVVGRAGDTDAALGPARSFDLVGAHRNDGRSPVVISSTPSPTPYGIESGTLRRPARE